MKEALIEYHQLLAVPRPVVLAPPPQILPTPEVANEKDSPCAVHETKTDAISTKEVVAGKLVELTLVDAAAGDAEPNVMVGEGLVEKTDPVGEVILDVNVASEELEIDDSLC